jgi:hypothetical protein
MGCVRQNFALEVRGDLLAQRHILGVTQCAVRLRLALGPSLLPQHHLGRLVAQRALDGEGGVAEVFVLEDARDRRDFHLATGGRLGCEFGSGDDLADNFLAVGVEHCGQLGFGELTEQIGDGGANARLLASPPRWCWRPRTSGRTPMKADM